MNFIWYAQILCISILLQPYCVANFPEDAHKKISYLTQLPSQFCSHYVRAPFDKLGKKLEPHIPDKYLELSLPLSGFALSLLSTQVWPAVIKEKRRKNKNIQEYRNMTLALNLFSLASYIACFNEKWTANTDKPNYDKIEWSLKNALCSLGIANSAYTIYKMYAPKPKKGN